MPESNLRRPIIVSAVLLAAYAAIVAWSFCEQATSWPHEGSWASVAFIFLCPGIVFQAFNLAFKRLKGRAALVFIFGAARRGHKKEDSA